MPNWGGGSGGGLEKDHIFSGFFFSHPSLIEGFNIVNVTKDILLTPTSVNVVIKSSQMAALVGVEEAARPDV